MDYLYYLIYFIVVFIIIFLCDYLIMKKPYLNKKKKKKDNEVFELTYIVSKFKLDKSKLNIKRCLIEFSLMNAFIISFTVVVLYILDLFIIWQFLIGFILLVGLIYSIYEIYGNILVKKGYIKK